MVSKKHAFKLMATSLKTIKSLDFKMKKLLI